MPKTKEKPTLGMRIAAFRDKAEVSREYLARKWNCSPVSVRNYELDIVDPRPAKLAEIEAWLAKNGGSK